MKKKIVLLLIVLVGMVVFTPNASAKTNATIKYKNYPGTGSNKIDSGIYFAAEGDFNSALGNAPQYKLHNEYIVMNGKEYKAWCVDPSLSAISGAGYTCSPLKDRGLQYVFENKTGDETTDATAFRFYAIYAGIGNTIIDDEGNEINHASLNAQKAALIRYLQVRNSPGTLPGYESNVHSDFLWGNEAAIEKAYQIATEAAQLKQALELEEATTGDGSGLKYTRSAYDATSVTYTVTSTFPMKQTEMEFTCENCASVDIVSWSDYSVTIKVNQLPGEEGCKFIINASFKQRGMYGCYGGEGKQFVVILVEDPEQTKFPFEGHNPKCGDECCEEEPLTEDIQGAIANCCEETTHSYVKEYDLDQLFCYHDGLQVDKYWEKCGADAYINKDVELNDYCDMYCTERATIDVPGAITAKSGRYFVLSKNPVGNTTSPYIQGFKRCRIRIKYDLWEKDYVAIVKEQIKQYNEYQYNEAYRQMYEKAVATKAFKDETKASISCTASDSDSDSGGSKALGTDWSCSAEVSESANFDCNVTYNRFDFYASNDKEYFYTKVKDDNQQLTKHLKLEIIPNRNGAREGITLPRYSDRWSAYDIEYKDCEELINSKEQIKFTDDDSDGGHHCHAEANYSCTLNRAEEIESHSEDVEGTYASYTGKASSAEGHYQSLAADAKTLEKKLTDCNEYFNMVSAGEMYEFNPAMSFKYSQIYRDEAGRSVLSEIGIPFKETPGCQITGPETGNITYEGGMDTAAPRYSGVYGTGIFDTTDFANTGLSLTTNGNGYKAFLDAKYDAKKIFTHDARYKAICEWEEDPNNVNTLVPNGAVNESAGANFTRHEYEYKVFLTTYDGTFETDWSVSNIGENGKFDDFIMDHGGSTCAGNPSSKDEMFSCTLHVEYEIVYTGKCNGTTKNPDDCDPVRNVDGLFQFKVANPSNIFPTGTTTDTGAAIAKNWTDTSEGQAVKAEIEQAGKRGLTYSPERESYKFHLTPETMRHIKNYNVTRNSGNIGGYSDFNLVCDCPDNVQTNTLQGGGVGCTKCRSILLSDLANNTISYEGQTYTVRAWSSQKSIDQVRNESHWR